MADPPTPRHETPVLPDGLDDAARVAAPEAGELAVGTVLILNLGPEMNVDADGAALPSANAIVRARGAELDAALLARVRPHTVVAPLIGREGDALTLVAQLVSLGYDGRIVVLAAPLPDRAMVERELRAAAPGLRLDLIERD